MPKAELAKTYDPHSVEKKWYEFWQRRGLFRLPSASQRPGAPAY